MHPQAALLRSWSKTVVARVGWPLELEARSPPQLKRDGQRVDAKTAGAFLDLLVAQFPQKINKVTTVSQRTLFTYWEPMSGGNLTADGRHPFAIACRANRIVHTEKPFEAPSEQKRRSRAVEIRLVGRAPSPTSR